MIQLQVEQPVKQSASDSAVAPSRRLSVDRQSRNSAPVTGAVTNVSSALSSFTPRDAFSSTTSPSRVSRASHSPASSGVATNSALMPPRRPLSTIGSASPLTPISNINLRLPRCAHPHSRCNSSPPRPTPASRPPPRSAAARPSPPAYPPSRRAPWAGIVAIVDDRNVAQLDDLPAFIRRDQRPQRARRLRQRQSTLQANRYRRQGIVNVMRSHQRQRYCLPVVLSHNSKGDPSAPRVWIFSARTSAAALSP